MFRQLACSCSDDPLQHISFFRRFAVRRNSAVAPSHFLGSPQALLHTPACRVVHACQHAYRHACPRVSDWHPVDVQFGYRMSKCAAHMAARCLAEELKPEGIVVGVVHPGVVQTDMVKISGSKADVRPEDSAAGIFKVISSLSMEDTGSFHDFRGKRMAW